MKFENLIISKGFKPAQFHKIVGIDRQVVYNYRKGAAKPSAENILRIANALKTTTDEVINCFYSIV